MSTRTPGPGSLHKLMFLLAFSGCGGESEGETRPPDDAGPTQASCLERTAELIVQCPPGSQPQVFAAGTAECVASGQLLDPGGAVEGICSTQSEGCVLFCNFSIPCTCGLDRVTDEGVFCAPCDAACGNGTCEGGEDPATCPEDCGDVCVPGTQRCSGSVREFCQPNGDWDPAACREDQACEAGRDRTWCQARLSPSGGTFVAPSGTPFEGDGDPLAIRFQAARLACEGGCQALRFVEGGARVLVREGQALALLDPATSVREDSGFTVQGAIAATDEHIATSARQPVVIDRTRRTTFTAEAIVDDTTALQTGGVALTDDGGELAVAMAVEGTPLVSLWETGQGSARHLLRFVDAEVAPAQATALAFSPGGALLAEGRPGGLVVIWNVAEGRYVHLLQTEVGEVTALAFPPTGEPHLLVGGRGLELWDVEAASRVWRDGRTSANFLAISPDGRAFAASGDGVSLRRLDDGTEVRALDATGPLHFAPDGRRLLAGAVIFADAF